MMKTIVFECRQPFVTDDYLEIISKLRKLKTALNKKYFNFRTTTKMKLRITICERVNYHLSLLNVLPYLVKLAK